MLLALTIISTLVALIMSRVAWRVSREERRRSTARVAALARDIHGDGPITSDGDLPLRAPTPAESVSSDAGTPTFLATRGPAATRPRFGLALALGGFIVASAAAAALVFSSESSRGSAAPRAPLAAPAPGGRLVPLELVALGHERNGDTLTVHGGIRNPPGGVEMSQLTAVIVVFSPDGGLMASGRALVESPALAPGTESTFDVTIPAAGTVGRYRVSFRSDDRIVPHIDKRSKP